MPHCQAGGSTRRGNRIPHIVALNKWPHSTPVLLAHGHVHCARRSLPLLLLLLLKDTLTVAARFVLLDHRRLHRSAIITNSHGRGTRISCHVSIQPPGSQQTSPGMLLVQLRLPAGLHEDVCRLPRQGDRLSTATREVEPRLPPSQQSRSHVISPGSFLSCVERAEPYPVPVHRLSDLGHPPAPAPLPDAPVLPLHGPARAGALITSSAHCVSHAPTGTVTTRAAGQCRRCCCHCCHCCCYYC